MSATHTKGWRARLTACDGHPERLLMMARLVVEGLDRLASEELTTVMEHQVTAQPPEDWAAAYRAAPTALVSLLQLWEPSVSVKEVPTEDRALGAWLRNLLATFERAVTRLDQLADPETGVVSDEATQTPELLAMVTQTQVQVAQLRIEIKAALDQVVALMTWKQSVSDLLAAAEAGEDRALFHVLQLNASLSKRPAILARIQRATANCDRRFLAELAKASGRRPTLRRRATVGLILLLLWDAGLKRLTYSQLRDFLHEVGVSHLPSPHALQRYGERLGLARYYRDPRKLQKR
ncbi:MAG TPA: hypothetical protein VJM82_03095 [Nitrospiraceae bacterium]|nr:hypothetical protein [Nitrospiraceae bacterium]